MSQYLLEVRYNEQDEWMIVRTVVGRVREFPTEEAVRNYVHDVAEQGDGPDVRKWRLVHNDRGVRHVRNIVDEITTRENKPWWELAR